MKKILVTGGAGYIGSFMVRSLLDEGYDVVVFDSLERGYEEAIDSRAKFIKGDIRNIDDLDRLFSDNSIDAVMHFAGYISVEESTRKPELYNDNNVIGSQNLFEKAIKNGIKKFIFSSTAAVYGNPVQIPIPEDHPKNPTSPYGESKLRVEEILSSFYKEDDSIGFVCLRYFNAAGASLDASLGEGHNPETHIVPLAIKAIIEDKEFNLYGSDYDTKDGTCVRDYIHVLDLVNSHLLALKKLDEESGEFYYNVGTGKGFSNREVLDMVERVSGRSLRIVEKERRAGDADQLIADPTKIKEDLAFDPAYSDLETIIKTAWEYHSKNSK